MPREDAMEHEEQREAMSSIREPRSTVTSPVVVGLWAVRPLLDMSGTI